MRGMVSVEIYKENISKEEERYQKTNQILDKCLEIASGVGLATATSSLLTMGMDNNSLMAMTAGTVVLSPIMYFGLKKLRSILEDKIHEMTLSTIHDFNLDNSIEYLQLIKRYNADPWYIENGYRNPSEITWDINFLKCVTQVIVRDHEEELMKTNEDHTNYTMVSSLVNESLMYALENDEDIIGPDVIIASFRTWDYLSQDMKETVVDTVINENNLDESLNPYRKKRGPTKIIEFKPKGTQKSE